MTGVPKDPGLRPRRLRRLQTVWSLRGRPLFFVTFCTANRQPWVACSIIHNAFKMFCSQSPHKAGVWVGQYVLMPDHVHLFVSAEGSRVLSNWVGALKRNLAKARRGMVHGPSAGNGNPANNKQCAGDDNPGLQQASGVGRPCKSGGNESVQPAGDTAPAHNPEESHDVFPNRRKFGRAWQDGFFDHVLRSSESYSEKWNYVRMNPVRAGLVNNAEDWPFSGGEIDVLRW